MKTTYSLLLGAAFTGVALFCVFLFWRAQFAHLELEEAAEALERQRLALLARNAAFYRLETDVAAGRLTLLEGAARLRDLNKKLRTLPIVETLRPVFPGDSEGERLCRELIHMVRTGLALEAPGRVAEVVGRLEAELQECLESDSVVRLPDPERLQN